MAQPANTKYTVWRQFLYSGIETCFGPSTQGAGAKTHLKSRFCAIFQKRGAMLEDIDGPCGLPPSDHREYATAIAI